MTDQRHWHRHTPAFIEDSFKDLTFALRILRKSPIFPAICILTLAFGIGASTAIFSLVNALLLRELPIHKPDQIAQITRSSGASIADDLSLPIFEQLQERQTVFSGMFGWWGPGILNVEANGELSQGLVWGVTGNCYSVLGVRPYLGRFLDDADAKLHAGTPTQVAVVGYGFWQQHYGGDPGVLGKTIVVEGNPFTVVGVAENGFTGLAITSEPDVTIPLTAKPLITGESREKLYSTAGAWLSVGGRLKDGVALDQARAQLESIWPSILEANVPADYRAEQATRYRESRIIVESLSHGDARLLRKRFTRPVLAVMGISCLILLIACVNLANLILARVTERSPEISIRIAIGASRWRIARQLLTETLMLSVTGTALGLVVAFEGSRWLRDSILANHIQPGVLKVGPDSSVIYFAVAEAILTAGLCAAASIVKAMRQKAAGSLRYHSRVSNVSGLGRGLIVAQIALSFVLLTCAGLFIHSYAKLRATNPGLKMKDTIIGGLSPVPGGYKKQDDGVYYPEMLRRISSLPGVRSASLIQSIPMSNFSIGVPVGAVEESAGAGAIVTDVQSVAPGFFESFGMEILQGRDLTWQDNGKAGRVAILSKRLADELFPSRDVIGRHIRIGSDRERRNLEIVGVVSNAAIWNPREQDSREVYEPLLQGGSRWSTLIVRTAPRSESVLAAIRSEIDGLGHERLQQPRSLAVQVDRSILEEYLTATLSEYFGALALILAAIGLYGVVSYSISRRTREIGIRVALGAGRGAVMGMILRETLILVAGGTAIGIPCALAAGRGMSHIIYGISPYDHITLLAVGGALALTAAVACYLPARRATRIEPTVALRCD